MPRFTIDLKSPTRTQLSTIFGLLGTGVLVGGALIVYLHRNPSAIATTDTKISRSVMRKADFPIFVPSKLPNGYTINDNSFSISSGVVTYMAVGAYGPYTFTQQSKPENFGLDLLSTQGLSNISEFTAVGSPAAIGTIQGRSMAVLSAPRTLVTVSAPNDNKSEALKSILSSLQVKSAR